ncbi:MAG: hypothetical protein ABIH42_06245, partial [Planctomycetota bacterium]
MKRIKKRERRIIGLLSACIILLTIGYDSAMWSNYYFAPELVSASNVTNTEKNNNKTNNPPLLLLCRENPTLELSDNLRIYTSDDGATWKFLICLPTPFGAVIIRGGELLIFHRDDFPSIDIAA